jgi:hypothetical protein
MYSCELTVELNENIEADVEVFFVCTHPGYRGTWDHPGEPPEFEIHDVALEHVYGRVWDKNPDDLPLEWFGVFQKAAEDAVDDYCELYEHQLDAYEEAH